MPRKAASSTAPARKRATASAAPPAPTGEDTDPEVGQMTLPAASEDIGFARLTEAAVFHNLLLYGREGAAKTTNLMHMANHGRIAVINAEGGLRIKALRKRGVNVDNIFLYPNKEQGEELTFKGLQRLFIRMKSDLAADPLSWFGLVMDSATDVHQVILDEVSDKRVQGLLDSGKEADRWFVDRGDYGTMSKMFRHLLRRFRDLDCHFGVTALERRDTDEDGGSVQYGPAITPGLQSDLLGYVDFVLACKAADDEGRPFRALTKRTGKYRAKDRDDVLPKIMTEPTFDRIHAYWSGDLDEATDPLQQGLIAESGGKKPGGGKKKKTAEAEAAADSTEPDEDAD